MPQEIDPEALYEHQEHFKEKNYLSELLIDQFYAPMQTQENLESNLTAIRQAYRMAQMDDVFVSHFIRIHDFLDKYEEEAAYRCPMVMNFPYTKEDFLSTDMPFREIAEQKSRFKLEQTRTRIQKQAEKVGIRNFSKLWQEYDKAHKREVMSDSRYGVEIAADCGIVRLQTGDWKFDDTGIWRNAGNGFEYACSHKIAPIRRLINLDTGEERLTIAFERGGELRTLTRPKQDLFDASKLLSLCTYGVAVTSKNAKILADYLCSIESLNYDEIPQQRSVARLGFLPDGRFFPYAEDVVYDGDAGYRRIVNAIREHGSYETWLACAGKYRNKSLIVRVELAASFASVLVGKLKILPFFVHLWGGDSNTGKTTAMQLAASVWGNPEMGGYVQTFNSTDVANEQVAGFLRNIPLCLDEGQLHLHEKFDVYKLAAGAGRGRGRKNGGVQDIPTWALCILTTGERRLVSEGDGAGAFNRVIDIECRPKEFIFETLDDFNEVIHTFTNHYGHAGHRFVDGLTEERVQRAHELFMAYQRELLQCDTTGKQAMAAAIILTADRMADEIIFHSGNWMSVAEITQFLKSRTTVSMGERGYGYLCDWIGMNIAKFSADSRTESYGVIDGDFAYINRTVFRKACAEGGFDEHALLSWLKVSNLIQTRGRNYTKGKRIAGVNVECVVLKLPSSSAEPDQFDELL